MNANWVVVIVFVVFFMLVCIFVCCKESEEETSNTPEIEYNSHQNNYQSLPTSMPLPQSELRDNGYSFEPHDPYPPEPSSLDFGYPEMPQPSTSSGIANVTPYPLTIRMPQPSGLHTHSTPQFSDTPPPYVRTRSHSAEELPPSYAEAVQKESQMKQNHPRSLSEIRTYDNI